MAAKSRMSTVPLATAAAEVTVQLLEREGHLNYPVGATSR
jgi:hypothetical protein